MLARYSVRLRSPVRGRALLPPLVGVSLRNPRAKDYRRETADFPGKMGDEAIRAFGLL